MVIRCAGLVFVIVVEASVRPYMYLAASISHGLSRVFNPFWRFSRNNLLHQFVIQIQMHFGVMDWFRFDRV
ncbi:MAG TPA: hypothetical protein DDW52_20225 [Planctomycetaceae bacterium]|nr:hypothetical protein [Planctomycetaceae bacterium]